MTYELDNTYSDVNGHNWKIVAAIVESHPVIEPGPPMARRLLIARSDSGTYMIVTKMGYDVTSNYSSDLKAIPSEHELAFTEWMKLGPALRAVLLAASKTKKLHSIKFLREQSGMGLTMAKYCLESFES